MEGISSASAIAAGGRHSLALVANGTVLAWGADGAGQLGDGSVTASAEAPEAVSGLTGVAQVAAGGDHSMALLNTGTVETWGENRRGELGEGSSGEPSDVPVTVTGLGEVHGIAAGAMHDLAYTEPVPTVSGVSPSSGPAAGGRKVTITGSSFEGVSAVHFGASSATSFIVESPETISAVAPAGALGTVDVTVTTAAGTSPTGVVDRFSYVGAPTVAKLSVKDSAGAGGTSVLITGTNLKGATSVSFGANAATGVTVESATSITAVAPAGSGTVNVTVTTPGGTSATSKHDHFAYMPSVTAITPPAARRSAARASRSRAPGSRRGSAQTGFKFASKKASDVECASSTSCTATTPANGAGTVTVTASVGKLKSAGNPQGTPSPTNRSPAPQARGPAAAAIPLDAYRAVLDVLGFVLRNHRPRRGRAALPLRRGAGQLLRAIPGRRWDPAERVWWSRLTPARLRRSRSCSRASRIRRR